MFGAGKLVHLRRGISAIYFMKKELSVFIDESGDLGEYQKHSPYYIVVFVFHNQEKVINDRISKLDTAISYLNLPNNYIHAGPIIRQEDDYYYVPIGNRRKAINIATNFIRIAPITYQSFVVDRDENNDPVNDVYRLSKMITDFIREHNDYFETEDDIKVYYDDGQSELSKLLATAMSYLRTNVIFKKVESANDYRFFQIADVISSFELIYKKIMDGKFSKSEMSFFKTKEQFIADYYNVILKKKIA